MSKIKALMDYTEAMDHPEKTITTFEGMSKFMGAMNELLYGVNTHKPETQEEDLVAENLEEEAVIEGKEEEN